MASNRKDWDEILGKLNKELPGLSDVDWQALFQSDPKILGALVNDVIKVAISEKGRPGKRSASNPEEINDDLSKLNGEDYSEFSFTEVMRKQLHKRSIRQVAAASGISKSAIQRLSVGESQPSMKDYEALAKAFRKDPSYFVEYRALKICAVLYQALCENPAGSVIQFEKMKDLK